MPPKNQGPARAELDLLGGDMQTPSDDDASSVSSGDDDDGAEGNDSEAPATEDKERYGDGSIDHSRDAGSCWRDCLGRQGMSRACWTQLLDAVIPTAVVLASPMAFQVGLFWASWSTTIVAHCSEDARLFASTIVFLRRLERGPRQIKQAS